MPSTIIPVMQPPHFPDGWENSRQQHTLLRTRMLEGQWDEDLRQALIKHVGLPRLQGWHGFDLSSNTFRTITESLAALYDRPPTVRHTSGDVVGFTERTADDDQSSILEEAGLWSIMQTFQAQVIGLRQNFLRITADVEGGQPFLRYRTVSPAFVLAWSLPEATDVPVAITEARMRKVSRDGKADKEWLWTWDYLDVSDPDEPIYRVHLEGTAQKTGKGRQGMDFLGVDITERALDGSFSGDDYPYRWAADGPRKGRPFLPYSIYHARRGAGMLFTPFDLRELVEGSINASVALSMAYHTMRDASWPQRYTVNCDVIGGVTDANDARDEKRRSVVSDPATVLGLQVRDPQIATVEVGQWEAGGDPLEQMEFVGMYTARLSQDAGISLADMQKATGNARSGYSIALTNAGRRHAQNRFRAPFTWADKRTLAMSAALINRATEADAQATDTSYPEGGYTIEYAAIPMSPEETRARDEHVMAMLDAGMMSKEEAYAGTHPGISEQQAKDELELIAQARPVEVTVEGDRGTVTGTAPADEVKPAAKQASQD